jgi:hypothetical protein
VELACITLESLLYCENKYIYIFSLINYYQLGITSYFHVVHVIKVTRVRRTANIRRI